MRWSAILNVRLYQHLYDKFIICSAATIYPSWMRCARRTSCCCRVCRRATGALRVAATSASCCSARLLVPAHVRARALAPRASRTARWPLGPTACNACLALTLTRLSCILYALSSRGSLMTHKSWVTYTDSFSYEYFMKDLSLMIRAWKIVT